MKLKTKLLFLVLGLILPYMAFVVYRVATHPNHPLPDWFIYVAPCYLFGSMLVFLLVRKRFVANAAPLAPSERQAQGITSARSFRFLGYIWLIGPVGYLLNGGFRQLPPWPAMLGLSWVSFLSWACFYQARKIESRLRQDMEVGPILGS
jgi:hypothetical protein